MSNLDLGHLNAQVNQQAKVEAGVRQFIGETAISIYALQVNKLPLFKKSSSSWTSKSHCNSQSLFVAIIQSK